MKSFFKRSAINLIVMGMAGSVYASHTPVPMNYDTWSPQLTEFFIGAEGLDLQPRNGDLDYVTVFPTGFPVTTGGSFLTKNVDPSYDWSWRVFGGIKFTDNDDITLSWMQLRATDNDSVTPADGVFSTPRWLLIREWEGVDSHASFDLDDAYAVWGHTINFNNPWSVRFAGGVEWAQLDSDLRVNATDNATGLGTVGYTSKSNMRGIGPRAEFDMTYHLPYGFALFGNANGALLVSKRDISLDPTVAFVDTGIFDFDFPASQYSDRHVVIPKFGLRLGASYSYVFGQSGGEGVCRGTTLTVDAGWHVESYIHAIERPDSSFAAGDVVTALQSSTTAIASTKTSNFSDQGFFVGIKLGAGWM